MTLQTSIKHFMQSIAPVPVEAHLRSRLCRSQNRQMESTEYFDRLVHVWSGVARQLDPLFCPSKIKDPNKRTPHATGYAYPAMLDDMGGCGTRPQFKYRAQTVLADNPHAVCASQRGIKGKTQLRGSERT